MSDFTDGLTDIWTAADDAGMLATATDDDGAFKVDFRRPVNMVGNNSLTNDYEIEYQSADRTLVEGDTLTISGAADPVDNGAYRVRKDPYILAAGNAADGTFRCALLTKVP